MNHDHASDENISWHDNRPARPLLAPWKGLMDKLGPMMHKNDKVIFGNPLASMRLDALHSVAGPELRVPLHQGCALVHLIRRQAVRSPAPTAGGQP